MRQPNTLELAHIKRIADHARAVDPDDETLLADCIEAETDGLDIADMLIGRIAELDAMMAANKARVEAIRERNARLAHARDACRSTLGKLLEAMGTRKLERPEATVSVRHVPPSLIDGPVPSDPRFIRTKVEPDRKAILDAVKAGEHVPGWALNNGSETLAVKFT